MANELEEKIKAKRKDEDIRVGVADRMIENWILADWERSIGNIEEKPTLTDGIHGSGKLKHHLGTYDKRTNGVNLFKKCRSKIIYENSPSFKHFADKIKDINCFFLKGI